MFTGLTAGLSSLRGNLLNGYGLLLLGWIHWPWINSFREWLGVGSLATTELGERIEDLFALDAFGPTAQLGALTFVAVTLGAPTERLVMSRLLDRLERRFGAPRWTTWTKPILDKVTEYGEKSKSWIEVPDSSAEPGGKRRVPKDVRSHFYEQHLYEAYQAATKEQSEARFRLNLLVLLSIIGLSLFLHGGWLWLFVALSGWAGIARLLLSLIHI